MDLDTVQGRRTRYMGLSSQTGRKDLLVNRGNSLLSWIPEAV